MNLKVVSKSWPVWLLMVFLASSVAARAQSGLIREVYENLFDGTLDTLTNFTPNFPDFPDTVSTIPEFDAPQNVGDYYGQSVHGYVVPPTNGTYIFWISSDDQSVLFLSRDESPANKREIASVTYYTGYRQFDASYEPNQKSAPILLEAGKRYYIQALHAEGSGADNLTVRWQLPDGQIEEPIPSTRLLAELIPPQIASQPQSTNTVENQSAGFDVRLSNLGPVSIQWLRNGTPIPGETNASLHLPAVALGQNGQRFSALLVNLFGTNKTDEATLSVEADLTPPSIVSAYTPGPDNLVALVFSEPVDGASSLALENFFLGGGAQVLAASLEQDGVTVLLRTTPLQIGVTYTLTVNGVSDLAAQPNPIAADTSVTVTFGYSPVTPSLIYGKPEAVGPSSRRTGLIISEIMYHPAPRTDGVNLEFIEIYNTAETILVLSDYRIAGAVEYTFPQGSFISAGGYLVVAAQPVELKARTDLSRVYGPYSGSLQNSSGSLRLLNPQGAVLLDAQYGSVPPWPASPDGTGHSLVLSRPSYGEADPRAYSQSAAFGGSPGHAEPAIPTAYQSVVINEFLAHSTPPREDYIELFNYSLAEINVSGCWLSDSPTTNKFKFPAGSVIPPLGYLSVNETQLGFGLSGDGESIFLTDPQKTRVLDSVRFGAQAADLPSGRWPDGNPVFRTLSQPTPGAPNSAPFREAVVISEIMYHPPEGAGNGEYVELYNRGTNTVDLAGWRFDKGISFAFPKNSILRPGAYAVVCADSSYLRGVYTNLSAANTFGDFAGTLSNSGETLRLLRPQSVIITNNVGKTTTNTLNITVAEISYKTGGTWGRWSDGGGSSLELLDPDADPNAGSSWADSDESRKSQWTTVEHRGYLDFGVTNWASANPSKSLHVLLEGDGEALLDNVAVIPDGSSNSVVNSTFEGGMTDWTATGTHELTTIEPGEGDASGKSLHVRAVARGDTSSNRLRAKLDPALKPNTIATLRARARWIAGNPELLLRLHGNYLEAAATLPIPANLGTPGLPNSRQSANLGPSITRVQHTPVLPRANQPIAVLAQAADAAGVSVVTLAYRLDPSTNVIRAPMVNVGAGYYQGTIPGMPQGQMIAFTIEAVDQKGARSVFPSGSPAREAMIQVGAQLQGTLGNYQLWLSSSNINRWTKRESSSNAGIDATFAYNNDRVVYNMRTLYSGSPFHWQSYNGPLASHANYLMLFGDDDQFLGQSDFVLNLPSNLSSDATAIREQTAFWMADQVGQPSNYRRYHTLKINGVGRGGPFEDAQQPNGDFLREWFPNDPDGELYKIEDWFEFSDTYSFRNVDATLDKWTTTNLTTHAPEPKLERYRWNFRKRSASRGNSDYTQLFQLVEALNNPDAATYRTRIEELVDIDEWMGAIAFRHAICDWDAYGYSRGKNMYAYKPTKGRWELLHWDIAFAFGLGDSPTHDLFDTLHFDGTDDAVTARMLKEPAFRRAFMRTIQRMVDGPLLASRVNPIIDARFEGLAAKYPGGLAAPDSVKQWISDRRDYLAGQVAGVSPAFGVTSPAGTLTTNRNQITVTGSAPVSVKTIRINGVVYDVNWINVTTWSARVAVSAAVKTLVIQGFDATDKPVPAALASLNVNYTGPSDKLDDRLVINEIQTHPSTPGAEFVELHNTSRSVAFDLAGARLDGVDFDFAESAVVPPGGFAVIAHDLASYHAAYPKAPEPVGVYQGKLRHEGDTLRLQRFDATGTNVVIIDAVTFENLPPWPALTNDDGTSLQLIDPSRDSSRAGNWASAKGIATPGATNSVRAVLPAFPNIWLNEILIGNTQQNADYAGEFDPWTELYNPSTNQISLAGLALSDDPANLIKWTFPPDAVIRPKEFLVVWLDAQPQQSVGRQYHTSFKASAPGFLGLSMNDGGVARVISYLNHPALPPRFSYGAFPDGQPHSHAAMFHTTPGAANDDTLAPVSVTINEWMASNQQTIADPVSGKYSDWFELYNAGDSPAVLSGYSLANTVANLSPNIIPNGVTIPAKGFLLVWADDSGPKADGPNGPVHVSFKLSSKGESIALFTPEGQVD